MVTETETQAPELELELEQKAPEQLALLTVNEPPLQFRLDQRTRERGLAHVAEIKARLAAMAEKRAA